MFIKLLVFLAFVAIVNSQKPKGCCVASQWETVMGSDQVLITGGPRISRLTSFLSVDYDKKKRAVLTQYVSEGVHGWVKVITDFNSMQKYTIDENKCVISSLKSPMTSQCIPSTSSYLGSSYFGGDDGKILFDSWSFFAPEYYANITLSVSQGSCIPLVEDIYTKTKTYESLTVGAFSSFTKGIKDPSVFNPPSSCYQDEQASKDTIGHFGHTVHMHAN